jgi:hypothetical protein
LKGSDLNLFLVKVVKWNDHGRNERSVPEQEKLWMDKIYSSMAVAGVAIFLQPLL